VTGQLTHEVAELLATMKAVPPFEIVTLIVTIFAALATAASAVFIAFQAVWTRECVMKTEATLEIARQEFARGSLVLADAQRARIDADMPRLSVSITRQARFGLEPGMREPVFDLDFNSGSYT
jgi:hypothetical protein